MLYLFESCDIVLIVQTLSPLLNTITSLKMIFPWITFLLLYEIPFKFICLYTFLPTLLGSFDLGIQNFNSLPITNSNAHFTSVSLLSSCSMFIQESRVPCFFGDFHLLEIIQIWTLLTIPHSYLPSPLNLMLSSLFTLYMTRKSLVSHFKLFMLTHLASLFIFLTAWIPSACVEFP
jgi:hypothetical protein